MPACALIPLIEPYFSLHSSITLFHFPSRFTCAHLPSRVMRDVPYAPRALAYFVSLSVLFQPLIPLIRCYTF